MEEEEYNYNQEEDYEEEEYFAWLADSITLYSHLGLYELSEPAIDVEWIQDEQYPLIYIFSFKNFYF